MSEAVDTSDEDYDRIASGIMRATFRMLDLASDFEAQQSDPPANQVDIGPFMAGCASGLVAFALTYGCEAELIISQLHEQMLNAASAHARSEDERAATAAKAEGRLQ